MSEVDNKEVRAPDSSIGPYTVVLKNVDSNNNQDLLGGEFDVWGRYENDKKHLVFDTYKTVEFIIDDNTSYTVHQTKSPSRYNPLPSIIKIRPTESGLELVAPVADSSTTLVKDEFAIDIYILTIKNAKGVILPSTGPQTSEAMKVVTNNSLTELIKLVKSQAKEVLNVEMSRSIHPDTLLSIASEGLRRFQYDLPCPPSKITMNCQISPGENTLLEDFGLLTYAEPLDGKIRCYFSDKPKQPYFIDSVELTPVVSIDNRVKKK